MSKHARKFIALFMLLWLPLSLGNALAASLAMQLPQGTCHEAMDMDEHGMMAHHGPPVHEDAPMQGSADDSGCTSCGICHLACAAWLDAPAVALQLAAVGSQTVRFLPEIFISHHSAPLVPPPLVAA